MHELSITKTLISTIQKKCIENKVEKPKKITIELGILTNYKKEPLIYYYDLLKKESSLLKSSTLIVNEVKAKIKCKDCKKQSIADDSMVIVFCPACESLNIEVIEGKDLKIKSLTY